MRFQEMMAQKFSVTFGFEIEEESCNGSHLFICAAVCRVSLPELPGESSDVTNDLISIVEAGIPAEGPVAKDPEIVVYCHGGSTVFGTCFCQRRSSQVEHSGKFQRRLSQKKGRKDDGFRTSFYQIVKRKLEERNRS